MEGEDRKLLPLKNRALNGSGGDRGSSPDDPYSSSPEKKQVDGYVAAGESKDAGGCEAPVPCHRRPVEPEALAEALSSAEKFVEKGKWIATEQQESSVAPQPPEKKFMHDGIRSSDQFKEREAAAAKASDEKDQKSEGGTGFTFLADLDLGEALQQRLKELGAMRARLVYRKQLQRSDVCPNQNRLLVSCKRGNRERCPITECLSAEERRRVENKDAGLVVKALDRDGVSHTLKCKFLHSNGAYRFISEWKIFLARNGLQLDAGGEWKRDVDVELWAFRSHALQRQPSIDENGKLVDEDIVLEVDKHFHPDGSLGLILLHHEHRERGNDDGGMGPPLPVAREKGKKRRDKRDAQAAAAASLVARGGAGAEPGETMSKVEIVDKYGESMSSVLIGLIMLQGANSEEKRDVGRGAISEEKPDNVDGEGEHGA
ncbi:hypothetical protein BAE44_0018133 [Dichanthelium oligosanthes]|uniref:Uncharacterized protein n=1 Tax=Dichanthelium oligosanthes TaxID=888268 RepID=A0A1E5V716_9POAL|nr:hypothetical protein BAE44_0018133 [Dichanthelium oligosanthes]